MPKFNVQRSVEVAVDPDKAFDLFSDFATWTTWSPWLSAEPEARVQVTKPSNAVGSIYRWEGEVVGAGEIEHQRLESPTRIEDQIRFLKPFRSMSQVAFDFEPSASGTRVTWHMHGSLPWFLFWLVPQMETFIGMDYHRGLSKAKQLVETGEIVSEIKLHGIVSLEPLHMIGTRYACRVEDIGSSLDAAFAELPERLEGIVDLDSAKVVSAYHKFDTKRGIFDCTSGAVVDQLPSTLPPGISSWSLPACQAFHVEHRGPHHNLGDAWAAANQHVRYKKLKQSRVGTFEAYRVGAGQASPENYITDVYLPLKGIPR